MSNMEKQNRQWEAVTLAVSKIDGVYHMPATDNNRIMIEAKANAAWIDAGGCTRLAARYEEESHSLQLSPTI